MHVGTDIAYSAFLARDNWFQRGLQHLGVEHLWWHRLDRPPDEVDIALDYETGTEAATLMRSPGAPTAFFPPDGEIDPSATSMGEAGMSGELEAGTL
jgi:hypothetical protein